MNKTKKQLGFNQLRHHCVDLGNLTLSNPDVSDINYWCVFEGEECRRSICPLWKRLRTVSTNQENAK